MDVAGPFPEDFVSFLTQAPLLVMVGFGWADLAGEYEGNVVCCNISSCVTLPTKGEGVTGALNSFYLECFAHNLSLKSQASSSALAKV